jgi:hypothetical protein
MSKVPDYYVGIDPSGAKMVAWDVLEAFELNYNKGCALKYLLRAGKKTEDPTRDLKCAIHCLERELALRESDK